jgi:hypothetical protein
MDEQNQEPVTPESLDDIFEPSLGELIDEEFDEVVAVSHKTQCLAERRRRAEQRLEDRRLRDEIGYYDIDLDDF